MSIIRIKFNTNGGEVTDLKIIEHNYGETYNLPNNPKRPGYDFLGWFTDPSNGDRIDENTVVPSRYSQMLYAHWRVKQINVSFDANGGSVPDDKVVTYQSIYGHLPTSVRYGYDFLGWFDKDKVDTTDIVTVTTDQVLVARWKPKKVNVIFDGNTGKPIARYTKVFDFGERLKLEPTTKDGHTFIGWFTEPVGGIKIEPSHIIKSTDDLVLYAQWEVNSYLISFDKNIDKNNGEDLAYDVKTVFFGDKYGTLPSVYKEGHRFVGWVDRHDKVINALTIMNTPRNHTLTAKWESTKSPSTSFDSKVNVIFDGNTGKPIVRYTKVFDFGERLKLEPTTKDGHTFIGWFTEPVGGIKIEPGHTITSTDDLVLYAQWEVNSYLVSFDKNTGEDLAYDDKIVFFGDKYGTLPYVYKEGHHFVGWIDRHGKVIDSLTVMNTPRNHTLTAKWESARSPFTSFDFEIIEDEE